VQVYIIAQMPVFWYFSESLHILTMTTNPEQLEEVEDEVQTHEPAKVILFNDEIHTFEDVIGQLIKAIHCSRGKGEALAWEVHTTGRAMVFAGEMSRCMQVSGILEEIQLMTQIEV
jgi:ATP-dependent Clp protease adaptor protein ClpS